jgi:erythromycin esterase
VAWLRQQAVVVRTAKPGSGLDDLQPIAQMIGAARVVALGEATYGARELVQLRHRLVELLVGQLGFTAFALEAGGAEAMAVNDYVVHGKGDPRAALAGLGQWPWETEEMVDLVRWLRGYNADPHHRRKVAFYGIDLQGTAEAARRVGSFIARVDRGDAARIARLLAPVQRRVGAAISADLAAIAAQLIARKARYVARSSAAAWQDAEHCAQLLIQIDREARANPRRRLRDRYLADNVRWILDHGPPGAKLVVWGHDGHVAFAHNLTYSMGMHLRAQLGSDYLAIGSVIHHGSTASLQRADDQLRLVEQRLDPPAAGSLEAALATVGRPQLVFDLRAAPPGVAGWFHSQVAARVALEPAHPQPVPTVLAEAYDALLYVEVATPATPIPAARARW